MSIALAHPKLDLAARVSAALASPYTGYAYAYPHKTAYRPLAPAQNIADIWRDEPREGVGVYVHIPFCEMRCGFCNLFTVANAKDDGVTAFLAALYREAETVAATAGPLAPASLTLGGGTPTYLPAHALADLLDHIARQFSISLATTPSLVETSPATATGDRLDVLIERGISRISIGVQSFLAAETKSLGRPQDVKDLIAALDRIRARTFQNLNIDLIYGSAAQTPQSWLQSLRMALSWAPEEIFLYPLYVRPLTGLHGRAQTFDNHRRALYRAGRDYLLSEGYSQLSMRMFRRGAAHNAAGSATGEAGDVHSGVIGLGAGARSRTRGLHYSGRYAVGRAAALSIIKNYCETEDFSQVHHGFALDRGEQMRRTILLDVLSAAGLDITAFETRYGCSPSAVLAELTPLLELGMLEHSGGRLRPTATGLEHADAMGPLLVSSNVEARMAAFERA